MENAGSYMSNGDENNDFRAGFEVDYMFAVNPGGGSENVFFDAVKLAGDDDAADYLGQAPQDGTPAAGPPDAEDNSGNPAFFPEGSIRFAFDNSAGAATGLEVAFPFSALGVTRAGEFQAFAFVVSSTGFFSNVTVPGNIAGDNPGFNADFNTLGGGPYSSTFVNLPVELARFEAALDGEAAVLTWTTASETDNAGFEVEQRIEGRFVQIGYAAGVGTTTEAQHYRFRTERLAPGTHAFRLKQMDLDGRFAYSPVVEVAVGLDRRFVLEPAYPNPFQERAVVRFAVGEAAPVRMELFNVLGQRVRVLYSGTPPAGVMQPVDLRAEGLASGLYFVRLMGESFSETRPVTLVR